MRHSIWCALGVALLLSACGFQSKKCDLVVHNATIISLDPMQSEYQAMAVTDGRIVELGAERQILNKYNAKNTYDARAQFVYPGFIDAHSHFLGLGQVLTQVNLKGTNSLGECLDRLRAFDKKNPASSWIIGRGWDQNDWPEKTYPTISSLDSIFPNRPVVLTRIDGHALWANSAALEKAGLDGTYNSEVDGILKNKEQDPTGIFIDNAMNLVLDSIPEYSIEQKTRALKRAEKKCLKAGLTNVCDAGLDWEEVDLIDSLQQNGELSIKVYAMINPKEKNLERIKDGPFITENLTARSVKLYADGALGSRGAALKRPYSDSTGHYGYILQEPNFYEKWIERCKRYGYQCNTHCIGDSANSLILKMYAKELGGMNDLRWRIEHAQIVSKEDLHYFGDFGIIPSVQPTHATSDMPWAGERLGKRESSAYAYKDLLNQLGLIALGTDFPVEDISPLETFYSAVARKNVSGKPDGGYQSSQALSREEALKGMTIWAALANFQDEHLGSIKTGKKADLTILDRDLRQVSEAQILNTEVVATFIDGEQVYP